MHAIQNLIRFNRSDVESVPSVILTKKQKRRRIQGGSVPSILKTLINFILTGPYVTKQLEAKQVLLNKAALLISQSNSFTHSTKSPK